jgi:hypothetical protein
MVWPNISHLLTRAALIGAATVREPCTATAQHHTGPETWPAGEPPLAKGAALHQITTPVLRNTRRIGKKGGIGLSGSAGLPSLQKLPNSPFSPVR